MDLKVYTPILRALKWTIKEPIDRACSPSDRYYPPTRHGEYFCTEENMEFGEGSWLGEVKWKQAL